MLTQVLNNQKVGEANTSQSITTKQIVFEVQNSYQVDMDSVLKALAKVKYGHNSSKELTVREKEIFCLTCNSVYSSLEKSFIRQYRRRISLEEIQIYIEILNDPNVNLNSRNSATKYRNFLRQEIAQNYSQSLELGLDIKLRIATASVRVFDDRTSWSKIKELINTVLNLDIDTQITPQMIMTLFGYQYPLDSKRLNNA